MHFLYSADTIYFGKIWQKIKYPKYLIMFCSKKIFKTMTSENNCIIESYQTVIYLKLFWKNMLSKKLFTAL